uniref:Uncharacterized protein n=1 Tax=Populus trichocarpa TaxID=3694 RepID=A0A3N7EJZ9_POPTR
MLCRIDVRTLFPFSRSSIELGRQALSRQDSSVNAVDKIQYLKFNTSQDPLKYKEENIKAFCL